MNARALEVAAVEVSSDRRRVVVTWADGRTIAAPAAWLADNAEGAFDPASGHRLGSALALADEVLEARIDGDALAVRLGSDGEARRVSLAALAMTDTDWGDHAAGPAAELWPAAAALAGEPAVSFAAYLGDDRALAETLGQVVRRGIAFLSGVGIEPGAVEQITARFGHVRETNYGRLFDVREEAAPIHLAYTPVGLDLHTDNPYREPPPTLQILHVIVAATAGGESQFADGFAHAAALRAEAPDKFERLAQTSVGFAYAGANGERYFATSPIIETSVAGEVVGVRVNHRALRTPPSSVAERWYEAYLDFYRRLHAPAARLERRLASGDAVIFDNRRLLHGRSPYGMAAAGAGRRWLQGCYADMDGLRATLSRLPGGGDPHGAGG